MHLDTSMCVTAMHYTTPMHKCFMYKLPTVTQATKGF